MTYALWNEQKRYTFIFNQLCEGYYGSNSRYDDVLLVGFMNEEWMWWTDSENRGFNHSTLSKLVLKGIVS